MPRTKGSKNRAPRKDKGVPRKHRPEVARVTGEGAGVVTEEPGQVPGDTKILTPVPVSTPLPPVPPIPPSNPAPSGVSTQQIKEIRNQVSAQNLPLADFSTPLGACLLGGDHSPFAMKDERVVCLKCAVVLGTVNGEIIEPFISEGNQKEVSKAPEVTPATPEATPIPDPVTKVPVVDPDSVQAAEVGKPVESAQEAGDKLEQARKETDPEAGVETSDGLQPDEENRSEPESESKVESKEPEEEPEWKKQQTALSKNGSIVSYKERGDYGDHKYPGNTTGKLIRDLLLHYRPTGLVFDPMAGSGTTGDVCKELGLPYYGLDIAAEAGGADHDTGCIFCSPYYGQFTASFIFWHPPYFDIKKYADQEPKECNLSAFSITNRGVKNYMAKAEVAFLRLAGEVLEPGGVMVVQMGDVRKGGKYVSMREFFYGFGKSAGLDLDGILVKHQHNMQSKAWMYKNKEGKAPFIPIYHEDVMIWKKGGKKE